MGSLSQLLEQLYLFELSLPGMFRSMGPVLSWVTFCDAHSSRTLCMLISIYSSYLHFRLGEYLPFFDAKKDSRLRGTCWVYDRQFMLRGTIIRTRGCDRELEED